MIIRIMRMIVAFFYARLDQCFLPKYLSPTWYLDCLMCRRDRDDVHFGPCLAVFFEKMGPIYVKFAQVLSLHVDVLPMSVIKALSRLHDQVKPFSSVVAKQMIKDALSIDHIHDVFIDFDDEPLAAASIAQVHRAKLKCNNHEVVVKVRRPNINVLIDADIAMLKRLATIGQRVSSEMRRLNVLAVVDEFDHIIQGEIDFMAEASNASMLLQQHDESQDLYVPRVYWDYTRESVMVIEALQHCVKVDDMHALDALNVDRKFLAQQGVIVFFSQVFSHSFFHADLHPGNMFIHVKDPKNPRFAVVDFGIMGSLSARDQRYLAENLLAFFKRDYRRVACLHIESNWVPKDTRIDHFEAAIRSVCEPIYARPLKDISIGMMLLKLFKIAKRFNLYNQPQLLLIQKTLFAVETTARRLHPGLDLWKTAKPFLESWVDSQIGWHAFRSKCRDLMPYWLEKLPELPLLVHHALSIAEHRPMPTNQTDLLYRGKRKRRWPIIIVLSILFGLIFMIVWLLVIMGYSY